MGRVIERLCSLKKMIHVTQKKPFEYLKKRLFERFYFLDSWSICILNFEFVDEGILNEDYHNCPCGVYVLE